MKSCPSCSIICWHSHMVMTQSWDRQCSNDWKRKISLSLVDSSSWGPRVLSSPLLYNPPRLSPMKIPAAEEASRWTCSTSLPTCWVLSQYLPSVIDYFSVYCQHLYPNRERKKCPIKVANEHGMDY